MLRLLRVNGSHLRRRLGFRMLCYKSTEKQGYEYNTSILSNSLNNNQWYIFFIYLKNRNKRHALGAKYPEYPTLHSTLVHSCDLKSMHFELERKKLILEQTSWILGLPSWNFAWPAVFLKRLEFEEYMYQISCYNSNYLLHDRSSSEERRRQFLDILSVWTTDWGLIISTEKSKALIPETIPLPCFHKNDNELDLCHQYK